MDSKLWTAFESAYPSLDGVDLAVFENWLHKVGLAEVQLTLEQLDRIYLGYLTLDCYWCILMWEVNHEKEVANIEADRTLAPLLWLYHFARPDKALKETPECPVKEE